MFYHSVWGNLWGEDGDQILWGDLIDLTDYNTSIVWGNQILWGDNLVWGDRWC